MCRYWYCWDCAGVDDPSVGIEDDTSPCLLVTWERPRCCTMCNDGDAPWREISAAEYAAYLREMDGDKAHMVFTDPPWNVAYGSDDNSKWKKRQIANDDMSAEDFRDFLGKTFGVMRQVMRGGDRVHRHVRAGVGQ